MSGVAIITGAGRGIGRAIASALGGRGYDVVVNDIGGSFEGQGADSSVALEVAEEITSAGGSAVADTNSVATMDGAAALVATALDHFGAVDVLVNNAGITRQNMIWDMTEEQFDQVVATNLKGMFACVKAAVPHMISQRSGSIVNMSSGVSIVGSVATSNYCASKAGVIGFSLSLAMELGPFGVRVNTVFPAGHSRLHTKHEPWRDRYRVTERPQMPATAWPVEAVVPVVLHLAGDEGRKVNGQIFSAGGTTLGWYDSWKVAREVTTPSLDDAPAITRALQHLLDGVANPSPAQEGTIDDFVWPWARGSSLPAADDAAGGAAL